MNLAEMRQRIFNQLDWSPTASTEAVARANDFINRAYEQLCLEAPFLFFKSELKFATQVDVVGNDGITDPTGTIFWDRLSCVEESTHPLGIRSTERHDSQVANDPTFAGNPWVFGWAEGSTMLDADWASFVSQGGVLPLVDGSWDGRRIDIATPDGVWHQNRIRTVWRTQFVSGQNHGSLYRVSLWHPFPIESLGGSVAAGALKYRIYTDRYYLPDDVIKVHSFLLDDQKGSRRYPMDVVFQQEAEAYSLDEHFFSAAGLPSTVFRREHFQLPAPNTAPLVGTADGFEVPVHWKGPVPAGTFSYIVTYTWGKRDFHFRFPGPAAFDSNWTANPSGGLTGEMTRATYTPGFPEDDMTVDPPGPYPHAEVMTGAARYREPLWESAPSPVSAQITTTNMNQLAAGSAVLLRVPNIDYMLGMLGMGAYWDGAQPDEFHQAFEGHSGWRVRIYRRRHTVDWKDYEKLSGGVAKGATFAALTPDLSRQTPEGHIEISDAYYLMAEVDTSYFDAPGVNPGGTHVGQRGFFIDDGQIQPDYSRRLRDVHGYQSVSIYPNPSARYVIRLNCLRRPPKLVDEQDVPLVHAEALNLLVDLAAGYWYEAEGAPDMSERMLKRYDRGLIDLKKRYGNLKSQAKPVLRRLSRAEVGFRRIRPLRKWWTVP